MASTPAPLDAQSMSPVPSPTTAPSFAAPSLLRSGWRRLPHPIRWLGVAIAGGSVVLTGVVLLVLPGPGIPLILLGLVILATEFAWAQRTLHHVRHRSSKVLSTIARRSTRKEPCP